MNIEKFSTVFATGSKLAQTCVTDGNVEQIMAVFVSHEGFIRAWTSISDPYVANWHDEDSCTLASFGMDY